ncbi:MAG TPA: hypothetical protein PKC98_03915, partial [Candidatus Melainabacteria bacterium]|nr:hypothetical protein [Candidatus Melainabacteria bacterium]
YQKEYELNDDGTPKTDANGNKVAKVDEQGNPVYKLDADGNRIKTGREIVTTNTGSYEVNRNNEDGSTTFRDLSTNVDGSLKNPAIVNGDISIDKYGVVTIDDRTNGTFSEVFMNGDSYTMFNDGSVVWKNSDNKVTETMNKYGDITSFDYDKDGKLTGMGQDGEYWSTSDGKTWYDSFGEPSEFRVEVKDNGDVHRIDDATNTTTIDSLADGTRSIVRDDGSLTTYKDGKLIASQDINGNTFEYSYDDKGLAAIKGPDGMIVRQGADVPGSENPTIAKDLKVNYNGDISYQLMVKQEFKNGLSPGEFVTQNADGTRATWASEPNGKNAVPTRIERTVPDGKGGTKQIELVRGEDGKYSSPDGTKYDSVQYDRFNGSLELRDAEGNKSKFNRDGSYSLEFGNGASKDFDSNGRMTKMTDAKGQKFTFKYQGDETVPIEVKNSEGTWKRSLDPTGQVDGNDVYSWKNKDTGYTFKGEVTTKNGEYSWKDESGIETTQLEDGGQLHKYKNGTAVRENSEGKVTEYRNPISGENLSVDYSTGKPVVTVEKGGKTEVIEGVTGLQKTREGLEIYRQNGQGKAETILHHTNGAEITKVGSEITSYKSKDGVELSKEAGTKDGKKIDKIEISDTGKAVVTLEGGDKRLYNDDGSSTTFGKDGRVSTLSADGNKEFVYQLSEADTKAVSQALEKNDFNSISV